MTDSPDPLAADLPEFVPVPTALRHDGWTPDRQQRFIAALALLGSVARACRAVGLSPASAYKLRGRADAAGFAEAWSIALAMGRDRVWAQAMDRALNGYTRPMRYRGKVVGHRHVFDNRLAYALAFGERMTDPLEVFNQSLSRIASSTSGDNDA
jgi:hypothetical protein